MIQSIDKLLTASATMSVELGPEASKDVLDAFNRVETAAQELAKATIAAWQKSLAERKPLSPGCSKLIQKALGK